MFYLSRQDLKQVWAIADSKRQRYLGFVEFIIAMQLISLAQSGQPITQDLLSSGVELKNLKPPTIDVEDLHGDLKQARYALQMAGVLSSDGQDLWTGGETVLIQVGDVLDPDEEEIAILSLLRSLDKQAKAKAISTLMYDLRKFEKVRGRKNSKGLGV
ncbi:Calcineurin-like metallo-phosphoesterase superfamily protein [Arachis hypogaea]|nr:Calcineurin-like metallo-phosphoesterase superfamily protein [Arachis hypogaea]